MVITKTSCTSITWLCSDISILKFYPRVWACLHTYNWLLHHLCWQFHHPVVKHGVMLLLTPIHLVLIFYFTVSLSKQELITPFMFLHLNPIFSEFLFPFFSQYCVVLKSRHSGYLLLDEQRKDKNHRIVWFGMDVQKLSSPTPCKEHSPNTLGCQNQLADMGFHWVQVSMQSLSSEKKNLILITVFPEDGAVVGSAGKAGRLSYFFSFFESSKII